ncbi:polysaccharide biosynthesis protein [Nocardioides ginsengisoli]|uniref:Polysaccharide biosynthesis protein n=1 Tax=Nocardioides ginsengisoli TaxID=363868 RepID=A0ABW3W8H9_9ACTN
MERRHLGGAPLVTALAASDALAWVVAVAVFCALRLSAVAGTTAEVDWPRVLAVGAATGLAHLVLGSGLQLYRRRAALGSLDEAFLLGSTVVVTGTALTLVSMVVVEPFLPRSVPIAAACLTLALTAAARAGLRRAAERRQERRARWQATPTLILGAGRSGRTVVEAMLAGLDHGWRPVGFLDDDPRRNNLRIRGVPVLGRTDDLARVVRETGAEALVVAAPHAPASTLRAWATAGRAAGLQVKILPAITDLPSGAADIRELRDIRVEDLLGRHVIDTDLPAVAGYLAGKRVLVTGAGGSIGSELCRQIKQFAPSELIMLDRDESALHAVQLSLEGRALLDTADVVLADIRDQEGLVRLFEERRPEVVFHAAALKHLPMLEQYPGEAVQTNVWGSLAVLEAAAAVGVERFVNVSTDKAADPICVLGYSKRLAECLTADVAARADGVFLSVRFGNVLGSRGSVLSTFASQIAGGGPVTVTHPDVTRYFMTIPEAVQLVIQAAAIGERGEVLVLDMGEPVRILDVAEQMMEMAGTTVPVEFTGLRPGEKLHEDLLAAGEPDARPRHPLVSQVPVPRLATDAVRRLDVREDPALLTHRLANTCASLRPQPSGIQVGA